MNETESISDIDHIKFIALLAKAIGKKYNRKIILSCNLTNILSFSEHSWYQIVTNNKKLLKSINTGGDKWMDKTFKKQLHTNIQNHIPDKIYNYLVMKSIDDETNLKDLLGYSGWEVLELLLEVISHKSDFRKFFVVIEKEKLKIISTGHPPVHLDW